MIITTQVTFKEYLKLLYGLTYRKPVMILILFVGAVMMAWIAGYYLQLLPLPKPSIYQFSTLLLITCVQPLFIYHTIYRNYTSSNHLGELLQIELTEDKIKIRGESFYTEIRWDKLYKIEELTNWFLLYQNTLSAVLIPKNDFRAGEMAAFMNILKSIRTVPVRLKR